MYVPSSLAGRTTESTAVLTELARRLDEALADDSRTAAARVDLLVKVRSDLERAVAVTDTFITEAELYADPETTRLFAIARENADMREEMLRRGISTTERLDEAGFASHEELDEHAEAGTLEEFAFSRVGHAFGLGLLKGTAFNAKVRRGGGGQFQNKPGVQVGRGGHKLRMPKSVVPDKPHAESHQPQGGLKHPGRVRAEVPTHTETGAHGKPLPVQPIKTLKGTKGGVKGKSFKVFPTPEPPKTGKPNREGAPEGLSSRQAKHDRAARGDSRAKIRAAGSKQIEKDARDLRKAAAEKKGTPEGEAAATAAAAKEAEHGKEHRVIDAGKKATFKSRIKPVEQRSEKAAKQVGKAVKKVDEPKPASPKPTASDPSGLTSAEVKFNAAGKVSSQTLLSYVTDAATQPTTVERYRNADGSYHPSRRALHERIIDGMLRQRNEDGSISYTNPYLTPEEQKRVLFTGGGYASGKGGMLKTLKAQGKVGKDTMVLDPDDIKGELPEFQAAVDTDPEANLLVYQEAWDVSQAAQERAQKLGLSMLVDGITNTSADEVHERIKSFTDAGYDTPEIHYVSSPTSTAIDTATRRMNTAKDTGSRRMIPEVVMRAVHRDVSATIPGVMERAAVMGADVHVYDSNNPKDATTGIRPPARLVATATSTGEVEYADKATYDAIIAKADEAIPGIVEPDATIPDAPTTINRGSTKEKGDVAKAVLGEHHDTEAKWSTEVADGKREYDPERIADVHEPYVEAAKRHRKTEVDENGKRSREFDPEGAPIEPPKEGEPKKALFSAGGPASGKGTVLPTIPGVSDHIDNAVGIDPDEAKGWQPEYQAMARVRDGWSGNGAHEESSHMSKLLLGQAFDEGLPVYVDSAGDSGDHNFLKKLTRAKDEGYDVSIVMADVDVPTAQERAIKRAKEEGRAFDPKLLENYHASVSKTFATYANQDWLDFKQFNTGTKPPTLFASKEKGETAVTVHDEELFKQFLAKGGLSPEDIEHVIATEKDGIVAGAATDKVAA